MVLRDVEYGPDFLQTMDVYLPPVLDDPPVILMLHGGAWMAGDKSVENVFARKAVHWLDKGYVFISANTRLMPQADPIEQAEDLAAAIAAAQSMAGSWGGRPDRFVLMGHSSGGHVAALVAADPAIAGNHNVTPWLGTVILDSGAFDVPGIMSAPHLRFYDFAFGKDPDFWRNSSPAYRLATAPAPMLLVCSSLSRNACARARAFAGKAETAEGRATVLPVRLSHMAINGELGTSSAYTEAVDTFLKSLGLP